MLHNCMMALLCGIICLGNSEPAMPPGAPVRRSAPRSAAAGDIRSRTDGLGVRQHLGSGRPERPHRQPGLRNAKRLSVFVPASRGREPHQEQRLSRRGRKACRGIRGAARHEEHLPLTITDGWRWEYLYSLSRYESATYDLPARGGSWDYALEAILSLSEATSSPLWIRVDDAPEGAANAQVDRMQSTIEVFGFSLVRPRDGYPKMQMF